MPTSLSEMLREDPHARVVDGVVSVVIVDRQVDHAVGPERGAAGERAALDPRVGDENLLQSWSSVPTKRARASASVVFASALFLT